MARNKYPEETIQKIVEAAANLFGQKGYDDTSIQDIVNELGGLSKGAIYHHFSSKEEILSAVLEYIYRGQEQRLQQALSPLPGETGFAQLRRVFRAATSIHVQRKAFSLQVKLLKSPRLLAMQLESSIYEVARPIVLPLVHKGMEDGSIPALPYPQEFAEVYLLLYNIWVNPMVFYSTPQELKRKCLFLRQIMLGLGFTEDFVDDEILADLQEYAALLQAPPTEQ